jgi:anti-sigma B factor antagonist
MVKEFEVSREQVRRDGTDVTVFRLKGYLDAHTAPRFEGALQECMEAGGVHLVVDCEHLEYISSAGLGVLIDAYRSVQPKEGSLRVSSMSAAIAEIFDILGFSKVIAVFPTLDDALGEHGESTA